VEQRTGVDGVVAFVVEFARSLLRVDGIAHCLRFSVSFLALIFLTQTLTSSEFARNARR
jgi:hypothetical protein